MIQTICKRLRDNCHFQGIDLVRQAVVKFLTVCLPFLIFVDETNGIETSLSRSIRRPRRRKRRTAKNRSIKSVSTFQELVLAVLCQRLLTPFLTVDKKIWKRKSIGDDGKAWPDLCSYLLLTGRPYRREPWDTSS